MSSIGDSLYRVCEADEGQDGCGGSGETDYCHCCGYGYVSNLHYHKCPNFGKEPPFVCSVCDGTGRVEIL